MLIVVIVIAALALAMLYQWLAFAYLPKKAAKTGLYGDHAAAIKRVRGYLALPSLTGEAGKWKARYYLAGRLLVARRYGEATTEYERLLDLRLKNLSESVIRRRLADCYEGQGLSEDAARERERCVDAADAAPNNTRSYLSRGELLKREGRFAEAYAQFEMAYGSSGLESDEFRASVAAKLAVTAVDAGWPAKCVEWGGLALCSQKPTIRAAMLRLMATAHRNLSNFADAERCYRDAIALGGSPEYICHAYAGLGGLKLACGLVEEALEIGRQAVAMAPAGDRQANINLYETLMEVGRFADARDVLMGPQGQPHFTPAAERRSSHVLDLALARVAVEMGDFDKGLALLDLAEPHFTDVKIGGYCRALRAWFLAESGQYDAAAALLQLGEAGVDAVSSSPGSQRDQLANLARAAIALGDYELGLRLAERLLTVPPLPVGKPHVRYLLGECHRLRGDGAAAAIEHQTAVDSGIETVWTVRARARLAEMRQPSAGGHD